MSDEVEQPPLRWRAAYRLNLARLPESYRSWIVTDLVRQGARGRFIWSIVFALTSTWLLYTTVLGIPATNVVPLLIFTLGIAVVLGSDRGWDGLKSSVLRRQGILNPAMVSAPRRGAGYWSDGKWYCDQHGRSFCRPCAPPSH